MVYFRVSLAITYTLLLIHTDAKSSSPDGTFNKPAAQARPRFRYWLPDASVDPETVRRDIIAAGNLGAGGVEFMPFYNYGGDQGIPNGSDWARYGFGTAAFVDMFKMALRTHSENGMYMDFPLGPNQGQGVPAEYDNEGLQWDLLPFVQAVPANGSFRGEVPGWGAGELIALTSAIAVSEGTGSPVLSPIAEELGAMPSNFTWPAYVLAHKSLRDHTNQLRTGSGQANIEFPPTPGNQTRLLFAFYETQPLARTLHVRVDEPTGTIFDNGSFTVDHHSARGAQTMIDFWEHHIIDDELLELFRQAGHYVWEDSIEIKGNITWTPSLPDLFKEMHGYDLRRFLPLLAFDQNSKMAQVSMNPAFACVLDTAYQGAGVIHDYRRTLEHGYNSYISTLQQWSNERLGLQYSCQPTYGLPQDMSAAIPIPDVPELESLAFGNSIDNYRRFIGAAHLSGKHIISNELGAEMFRAYNQPLKDLIDTVHIATIGGTNQLILHGQTFSGTWYETTWPGFTPFQYSFSELYSPKQPAWEHGMAEIIEYFSRLQYVQRQGIPRTDIAIITKESRTHENSSPLYVPFDLEDAGWTYSYLSPVSFDLPQAYVQDGLLGPDGPQWQALVVQQTDNLTLSDVEAIHSFARSGLPIILSGGLPQYWPTGNSCSKGRFIKATNDLAESETVHIVDVGEAAAKLFSLGLLPRARVEANGKVYTTWREDAANNVTYTVMFNFESAPVAGNAVFRTSGPARPFQLDAWMGEERPILQYKEEQGHLVIPIQLEPRQTFILAIRSAYGPVSNQAACHFTDLPSNVLEVTDHQSSLTVRLKTATSAGLGTLSSGNTITFSSNNTVEPFDLSDWTLTAETWKRPSKIEDMVTIATKANTTLEIDTLKPWGEIDGLKNSSGIGYYSTTFEWNSVQAAGAHLKAANVTHTLRILVNGVMVEPFDHQDPVRDISRYLLNGTNQVLIVTPTTLWSYLSTILDDIRESGVSLQGIELAKMFPQLFTPQPMGLIGRVTVIPFEEVHVSCESSSH